MIRRRLFAYTVMYAIGIVAGYLLCERAKLVIATILLIFVGLILTKLDLETNNNYKYQRILFTIMLLSTSMFVISYINLYTNIDTSNINCVEGKIIRVSSRQDGIQFVIKPDNKQYGNKVLVNYYTDFELDTYDKYIGSEYRFNGKLKKPSGAMNPGCFDYALYLKSQDIKYVFTAKSINKLETDNISILDRYRIFIMSKRIAFEQLFEGETASLVKGMLFGDKNDIDEVTREEFNKNGTGHILAVSGLHIGFLFALLRMATKKRRTVGVYIGIVVIVVMYGQMTQWSASTIRAVLVMSISLFSMHLRRPFDMLTSVSLAALILMIYNPHNLFSAGFQMSFLAMIGITFLTKPLSFLIGDYLSMLIAVQIAVMPYTAFMFNSINPMSLFINIPIVAIAAIIVPICIIGIAIISAFGMVPNLIVDYINAGCKLLININSMFYSKGTLSFQIKSINAGILIGLYVLIFVISSEWTRIRLIRKDNDVIKQICKYIGVLGVILAIAFFNPFINDEIVFVNVGQGDCTHIRCKGINVLIDGGGQSELFSDYNTGEKTLMPYLLKNACNRLDAAYLTHLHTDHYRGIEELNEVFHIGYIGISRQYYGSDDLPSNTKLFTANASIKLSRKCSITAIWPIGDGAKERIDTSEKNEKNTVYIIDYEGIKTMVTGDLMEEDELKMVNYYKNTDVLDCDVLKVAHHGSKSSTSEEFLDAVTPRIAVISVGENNMYGHPNQQTLDRLNTRNIKIYRTDQDGAVGIDIRNRLFLNHAEIFAHCSKSLN